MSRVVVSGFDLATRLTGWCAGDGEELPACGAYQFPMYGDDLGALGKHWDDYLQIHFARFNPTRVIYEAPILVVNHRGRGPGRRTDDMGKLRKLYGMGFYLEAFCKKRGVPCAEESLQALKSQLTGNRHASKGDMVFVAQKVGLELPPNKAQGMEDAADAFAAWLCGIRHHNKALSARYDSLIWGRRGALL